MKEERYDHDKSPEERKKERKANKEKELAFYICQDEYLYEDSKEAWDSMFLYMNDAITYAIKKKLKGVKRTDIEELAMDATIQVMNRYKTNKSYKITKLLSVAYWASLGVLYNAKRQAEDRELSYDAWLEYQYAHEE